MHRHVFAGVATLAVTIALACLGMGRALADTRVALVIGNAKYTSKPLQNPVNDARLVELTLKEMGFQVERIEDATLDAMRYAARAFLKKSQDADIALFYYAGHAAQLRGNNYLAPIDGKIAYDDELESRGLNLTEEIAARLDRRGRQGQLSIVILDACRDNPFPSRQRSMARGLAALPSKPEGMLLAFSTGPGDIAQDSPDFRNSRYTAHLVDAMRIPGLEVRDVFARVRDAVTEETRGGKFPQTPWFNSSANTAGFCFVRTPDGKCGGVAPPPLVLARNALSSSASRNLGDDAVGRAANDPLSVALIYRINNEADDVGPDNIRQWRERAGSGDPFAMTVLGLYHGWHDKEARRLYDNYRPDAVHWLRKAADAGYPPALFELGQAYENGWVTDKKDLQMALQHYNIGVQQRYAPAQSHAGRLVRKIDPKTAFIMFHLASDQGFTQAMGYLARAYLKGLGTGRDIAKAEYWARRQYAMGAPEMSQHLLGYMYANGLIQPKDDMDRLRLAGLARLKEQFGEFLWDVE